MAMKKKTLTYEEYQKLIRTRLKPKLSNLSDQEFETFLSSVDETIHEWYDRDNIEYEADRITYEQFAEGSVAGAAYALGLMW